ncbi:hypothetical protein AABB24_039120 [Solanum stoloniferum]|uniref:Cytochrome P450 n=1 Tax=Solanum stoloniferum TaxID=62892 RepID=A0ABD2QP74_9SOLN
MSLIWEVVVVVTIVYVLYELLNIHNRKKLPPGPRGLPILGHLHLLGKNPHHDFQNLAKKHGPIMYMRLGLVPTIVVSSTDVAEKILKTYDHIFANKPHNEAGHYLAYGQKNIIFAKYGPYWRNMRKLCTQHLLTNQKINSFQSLRRQQVELMIKSLQNEGHYLAYGQKNIIFAKYGPYWRNMRKLCTQHLLTNQKINSFQSLRRQQVELMIKSLQNEGRDNRVVVDLSERVASLNANMTCLMVFGKKYMDEDFDKRGFKAVLQEVVHLAAITNLGDFFPFLGVIDLQGLTRRLKDLSKVFDEFLEKIINEHVESRDENQSKDFVDTMLDIMQSGKMEFQFDRIHIKAVLFVCYFILLIIIRSL